MKIAIIGVLEPLAQQFLQFYNDESIDEHEFLLVDFVQPAPFLELGKREYPVLPYTPNLLTDTVDLAICFGSPERKPIILELEDKGIRTIDLTESFISEPTVPVVLFDHINLRDQLIFAAPSLHQHVLGPILLKLHQRFTLKRVSMTVFPPQLEVPRFFPDKLTEEEMGLINESIRLLDNNQVHITASIRPLVNQSETIYHVNVEFVRPFNMDSVREVISSAPAMILNDTFTKDSDITRSIVVNRVRRDFSADSAIHLSLSVEKPENRVFDNILRLIQQLNA